MSILNYLHETLQPSEQYIDKLLNDLLSEDVDNILPKPDNFKYTTNGDTTTYSFDIDYVEGGEPKSLTMVVDITSDCDDKSIDISFDEQGGTSGTTDRGQSPSEKLEIVNTKMEAITYCIGYHMESIECEMNKIKFTAVSSLKDRQLKNNRRANLYIAFAKKYIPKLGLEILDIKEKGALSKKVVITTTPFGKTN